MIGNIKVEVCCGSVEDCLIAQKCHADRIELNHGLELGGLTPSVGTLKKAKELVTLPIACMVRHRGKGFCYTELEFEAMLLDAKNLIDNGADGIVFGFLHEDGTIDIERTKKMVEVIGDKEKVFHKAFDSCPDFDEGMQILIDCGIDRVLTSAGKDIVKGAKTLNALQKKYGSKIQILAGGGVREHNVQEILNVSGCIQIHMTAKEMKLDSSILHYHSTADENSASYVAVSETNLKGIMKKIEEK